MNKCEQNGRHKFKPRYSEKYPDWLTKRAGLTHVKSFQFNNLHMEKVYECDVCEWCGKVVMPQPSYILEPRKPQKYTNSEVL